MGPGPAGPAAGLHPLTGAQVQRGAAAASEADGRGAPAGLGRPGRLTLVNTAVQPQRVHIIGGGGARKTTLGRQLAAVLGLELAELDSGTDLGQLARRPRWVAEGIFVYGAGELLQRADLIIWLDLPRRVAWRRILTRHLKLTVTGANPHRGWRLLGRFLMSQRRYYTEPRPGTCRAHRLGGHNPGLHHPPARSAPGPRPGAAQPA